MSSKINAADYPFDHENGNAIVPFTTLMGLMPMQVPKSDSASTVESLSSPSNSWIFRSTYPGYAPGGFTRAFGGHVYAQTCVAASRTVKPGFVVHVRLKLIRVTVEKKKC
jgi:hypothetical protein